MNLIDGVFPDAGKSTSLTVEMLEEAMTQIQDCQYEPCSHVVHPRAQGWSICGMCGNAVYVPEARIK